jgi:hypothetical protein
MCPPETIYSNIIHEVSHGDYFFILDETLDAKCTNISLLKAFPATTYCHKK